MNAKNPPGPGNARIVGLLFLVQMIAASVSHSVLLSPLLRDTELLTAVAGHRSQLIWGVLLDLVCGLSVFAIGVLVYPLLKMFSESRALWYVGLRLNEWVCVMISGILLLTLINLSARYAEAGSAQALQLPEIGFSVLKARNWTKILMLLGFCFSAGIFYHLLFQFRLLPRFIAIWGLAGVALLFSEVIANIFGSSLGGIKIMLPLGLNEIFMGVWFLIKGWNYNQQGSAFPPASKAAVPVR